MPRCCLVWFLVSNYRLKFEFPMISIVIHNESCQRYGMNFFRSLCSVIFVTIQPLLFVTAAQGQETDAVYDSGEYIVTGTRTPERTLIDSPVPIDVLSQEDLRQSGAIQGELGEILDTILPSAFMARDSNNDLADIVRTVQLRGLDPAHTLVLINGKRRHNVSIVKGTSVDLNNIPASSIKRIEVLRDGASAQYGSDAIAGVINIVLKDADEGGAMSTTYGGHVTNFKPTGETIADGQTILLSANRGFELFKNGYLNLSAEIRDRESTNRAGAPDNIPTFENQTAPNLALKGKQNFRAGDSAFTDFNSMFNAGLNLLNNLEFYSFGSFSYREAEGLNFFRFPDSSSNVQAIYPNGFIPITDTSQIDYSIVAGLKGITTNKWNWDTSLTFGGNEFDFNMSNSLNASFGTASPTEFDVAKYTFKNLILNIDLTKPIDIDLFMNPLNVAYGFEYRHEIYATDSGDVASYKAGPLASTAAVGVQGNGGLKPEDTVDVSRDETAIYLDLESNVTDKLLLDTAGRFEYYSDFGETINGKVSARYELTSRFALRGSAGTGFRAPSLTQAFFSGGTTDYDTGSLKLVSNSFLPATNAVAQLLGAEELEAEESTNFSVGFTFNTAGGLKFSADAYQINIDNRIILSESIGGTAVTNFINTKLGISDIKTVRFFTNAVNTSTKGIDIVADYTFDVTDYSTLNLRAAGSYAETNVENVKANPTVLNNLGATLISSNTVSGIERNRPSTKVVLSGNWITNNLSVLVRASYLGTTEHNTSFGQQKHSHEWVFDMDMEYDLTDKISVAIGGNNIFDNYPDRTVSGNSYFGNFPYDIVAPIGMNGAYYYARLTYNY